MKLPWIGWVHHWQRILVWAGGGIIALALIFGLLGYFWLPGFVKSRIEISLSKTLHRPVTIQRVSISPFSLSASMEGFKAGDVLSVRGTYVKLSFSSLFRLMPVVSRIHVDQPELHLVRESIVRLNISDLINTADEKPGEPIPEFSISNITLERGRVEWIDKVVGETQTISEIALGIPFIANVPSQVKVFIEPRFTARINGAPISLNGKLRPFGAGQDAIIDLKLANFDLIPLARYIALPINLRSAQLDTQLNIRFHRPQGNEEPGLFIEGDTSLHDVDFKIGQQNLAFSRFKLIGLKAAPFAQRVDLREAILVEPALKLLRGKQGTMDIGTLLVSSPSRPDSSVKPEQDLTWSLGRFAVENGSVHYEDVTLHPAGFMEMSALGFQTGPIDSGRHEQFPIVLTAKVNGSGRIDVSGSGALSGDADLKMNLNRLDLVPLQGWLSDRLNVVLTKGYLSFEGNAKLAGSRSLASGNLLLSDFSVLDRMNAEDLLNWKILSLGKLAFASDPFSLAIGNVELKDFYAKALINPQGRLNLKDIVRETEAKPAPASSASPSAVHIGAVTLAGGTVNFSDKYIKPNYTARITDLSGHIDALAAGAMSLLELHGKVERTAPLEITGRIDPFSSQLGLNIKASARGIDLPSFSSYSGRYMGYGIEKGKFSMDVSYKVEKGELAAENKLFLDQLTLGKKVESKDATKLPVRLAIALLKNSRGEINIDLPIRGSLNDPEFSLGGIIVKVMLNLVTKAVTSPFKLLGSLFGGGKDLSQASFTPGASRLTPEVEDRLQSIAKAMIDRPGLTLEVTGMADPTADKDGLKNAMLEQRLRAQKLADQASQGKSGTLSEISLSAEEKPVYLARIYKADNPAGQSEESLSPEDMEARSLASISVSDAELTTLAEDRGQRVQAWLAEKGNIPSERIFLLAPKIEPANGDKGGSRVQFSLR